MPDQEAVAYPESFVSAEDTAEAQDPRKGSGTPASAPEVAPPVTFVDRICRVLGRW